ncbi:MAG: hypothetical protein AAGH15_20660 [Myxococcota bacterium]
MPRFLPLLTLLGAAACMPPAYQPPSETEPHAILKVRHVVHRRAGPNYASDVRLGEFAIDERTIDSLAIGGTDSPSHTFYLRVRPDAAPLRIGGNSSHQEQRMVTRYRTVTESYTCTEYSCTGYGNNRTCANRTRTCTRTKQEPYQALEWVTVVDDACEATMSFAPHVGGTYLVQFDYVGENECRLSCFEQRPRLGGEFEMVPCPVPPPPAG